MSDSDTQGNESAFYRHLVMKPGDCFRSLCGLPTKQDEIMVT